MRDLRKKYSEELRRYIVNQLESGEDSMADLSKEHGIDRSLIRRWLQDYGKFKPEKSIVEVVMKSEKERIAALEKALADAHLKIRAYDELIKIADKEHNLGLKKSIGIALSEVSKETDLKSARSVRSSK